MNKSVAVIYLAFFALIGFAVWATKSIWPMVFLILTPSYKFGKDNDKEDKEKT